jgi:RHS family protein
MNGKIIEETQLGLNPELGRYISQDSIMLAGDDIKLYWYVENSLSWIDPFGLTSISYAEEAKALGYKSVNNQCSHGSAYIQERA